MRHLYSAVFLLPATLLPLPLYGNRPCIVFLGGASLSVLQIYSEGWILSSSCAFAGWTRWYRWCIAVYFRFFASKALHCTLYDADHFFAISAMDVDHIDMYSPGAVSISNVLGAVLCLPRFWAPQSVVLTTGPSHMSTLALW